MASIRDSMSRSLQREAAGRAPPGPAAADKKRAAESRSKASRLDRPERSGFPAHAETAEFEGGSAVSGRRVRTRGRPEGCSSIERRFSPALNARIDLPLVQHSRQGALRLSLIMFRVPRDPPKVGVCHAHAGAHSTRTRPVSGPHARAHDPPLDISPKNGGWSGHRVGSDLGRQTQTPAGRRAPLSDAAQRGPRRIFTDRIQRELQ